MADAPSAAAERRLYEAGFEGWDIQELSYTTDYIIMIVGVVLAFLTYELMKPDKPKVWTVLGQMGLYALFSGVGYGFAGISHHMLDTYYERGHRMGLAVGEPQAEWILPWLLKLFFVPLAGACGAGTAFHFAGLGVGWIKLTKALAVAVSCFETYLTLSNQVGVSGAATVYFGALTAAAAIVVILVTGRNEVGQIQVILSNVSRIVGLAITVFAPKSCRMVGHYREGCPFSEVFNHNAWYHVFTAVSLILCYWGVARKSKKDADLAYMTVLRTMPGTNNRTCCGLA